jgi:hypothetical protein
MPTKSPRIQWQRRPQDYRLKQAFCAAGYTVTRVGDYWYWFDRDHAKSRPYIDREDAMRGAQRHHEERDNG